MNRIEKLPLAFAQFEKMGGELDFSIFDNASGTEEEILLAIQQTLGRTYSFDAERLRSLGCRSITEQEFFGDWYDPKDGSLLKVRRMQIIHERVLKNPKISVLDRMQGLPGCSAIPKVGSGGEFAYAFSDPPYTMRARPGEVQAVFDKISGYLLPPEHRNEINDWSSPLLTEVSDYFEAGMEWWGVFLFSIYTPDIKRLSIIAGSTTD